MNRSRIATFAVTAAASLLASAPAMAHSIGTPQVTQKTLEIEQLGPKYLLISRPTQVSPEQASRIEQYGPKYCWVGRTSVHACVIQHLASAI
jgi:hypothetical protein